MPLCTGPERPKKKEKKKEHTEREMQNFLCQLSGMKEMFMENQLFWEPWKKGEDPHHTITVAPCTEHPGFPPSEIKSSSQPWDLPWHFISSSDHTILTWYKSTMKYWRAKKCNHSVVRDSKWSGNLLRKRGKKNHTVVWRKPWDLRYEWVFAQITCSQQDP